MSKTAIVGIDGGSWDVLKPMIERGLSPTFRRLMEEGVHASLKSVIPPVTGVAWLAMATGLNPGKTGVIDFFKHEGNVVFKPISSYDYRGRAFWDFLSALGFKVAILDYPMLYPAYPVNGVMISSWGPKLSNLADVVRNVVGGEYEIFVNYHLEKYDDVDLFIEDLSKAVEKKIRLSRHMAKGGWDLFVDVISFTDWLQHRMWHYIDPRHPYYPGGS